MGSIGAGGRGSSIIVEPINEVNQTEHLKQLHKLLIEPITDLLPSDPNAHVVFIPQDGLFLVPFPALQDDQGKYLIEKHTIFTAPATQVLDLTHRKRINVQQANLQRAVVLGNPTMPKVTSRDGTEQLRPLPGAEQEAQAIATILKTNAITGSRGTKAAILQQMPTARLIHLATHGLLDDSQQLDLSIPGAIRPRSF